MRADPTDKTKRAPDAAGVSTAAEQALFQEAADSTPAPLWMTNSSGDVEFINRAFQEFAGAPAKALMGNVWLSYVHPEDVPGVAERRAAAWADDHAAYRFEARFRRADGEWRLMEVSSRPRRGSNGEFNGYVGLAIDITERMRAEAARRQLIAIVESSSDAIISTDLNGVINTWNAGAELLYGYTAPEAVGQPVELLVPTQLHAEEAEIFRRVRAGERIKHYETVRRRKDGSLIAISLTISPVRDERGAAVGVSKIARDITDEKRAADALSESERRYRELVDGLSDAIVWEGDPETFRFTFVSGAAERLLGYPVQRWTDDAEFWAAHIHPDDREWAIEYCVQETAAGRNHEFEYRMIAADGRTVWLRDKVYLSKGMDGRRLSRGIMLDITEAKRRDDALRARDAELELVARMTPLALVRLDRDLVYRFVNRASAARLGLTPEQMVGRRLPDVMDKELVAEIKPYIDRVLKGEAVEFEAEVSYPKLGQRWMHVVYTPERNLDGEVSGFLISAIDITDRKKAEEHRKLLIDELNHRVRNTLAVVQSVARQTFKDNQASESARSAFEGRLLALARAHGLLTRTNWERAAMEDIVREAILAGVPAPSRVSTEGPRLLLEPKSALAVAMALHELFTNALKYGSLSNEDGRIEIAWRLLGDGRFELRWVESGGPPVAPPRRRGYGSVMIEDALARDLRGKAVIEYRPEGVRCVITAPYPDRAA